MICISLFAGVYPEFGLAARSSRRYADVDQAYARMQQANPRLSDEQARHLTRHGSNQNEDGTLSWKYDNYTYNFSASGMTEQDTIALWKRMTCPVLIINVGDGLEHRIGQDDTDKHFANVSASTPEETGYWMLMNSNASQG